MSENPNLSQQEFYVTIGIALQMDADRYKEKSDKRN